ncbi:MAG: FeoA family protein [Pseudomonadota bacterium]
MSNLKTNMPAAITLDQLRVGDRALVSDVSANQNSANGNTFDISRRLKELGFIKGEAVRILHRGYFGGEPLAVRIGQSTFALRLFEAALIGVVPAGSV